MGKRLPKKELLAQIKTERACLLALIESTPKRNLTLVGMNNANWSIKDVLTHLLDWETRVVNWCEIGQAGETPDVPGNGFQWNQTRELNALIQMKHCRKSMKTIWQEFDDAHLRTVALIRSMNNQQLTTIGYFHWTGKSWTASDYLLANTGNHYKWATNKIRKWLKSIDQQKH